jgi:hypothetical protein
LLQGGLPFSPHSGEWYRLCCSHLQRRCPSGLSGPTTGPTHAFTWHPALCSSDFPLHSRAAVTGTSCLAQLCCRVWFVKVATVYTGRLTYNYTIGRALPPLPARKLNGGTRPMSGSAVRRLKRTLEPTPRARAISSQADGAWRSVRSGSSSGNSQGSNLRWDRACPARASAPDAAPCQPESSRSCSANGRTL